MDEGAGAVVVIDDGFTARVQVETLPDFLLLDTLLRTG